MVVSGFQSPPRVASRRRGLSGSSFCLFRSHGRHFVGNVIMMMSCFAKGIEEKGINLERPFCFCRPLRQDPPRQQEALGWQRQRKSHRPSSGHCIADSEWWEADSLEGLHSIAESMEFARKGMARLCGMEGFHFGRWHWFVFAGQDIPQGAHLWQGVLGRNLMSLTSTCRDTG